MRILLVGLLLVTGLREDEKLAKALAEFRVESVIDETVAGLGKPVWYPEIVSWRPVVSTSSDEAQKHVHQGMALVHAGWDFEAYRHFVEAVKLDGDCLMAYWGMSLALAEANQEWVEERMAALDRMFDLSEAGMGTELERKQVEALAYLFSDERALAPPKFKEVVEAFPNDLQSGLMAAYLGKDGYDPLMGAGPGQKEAVADVEDLLRRNAESQMALLFWVLLQAEHPDGTGHMREVVLPRVRSLAGMAPDFPPYRHLLGHYEWRGGNLGLARREFEAAVRGYEEYMGREGLEFYDCPNWVRAKLYLAATLNGLGEFDEAMAIGEELRRLEVAKERVESPGASEVLWEGKTLAARLFLGRGAEGDFLKGMEALPDKEEGQQLVMVSPSVVAWEAWRNVLAGRNALQRQVLDSAAQYLNQTAQSEDILLGFAKMVNTRTSRSSWARSRYGLEMERLRLKGDLMKAQGGDLVSRAEFWLQSAVDREKIPAGLKPPVLLSPPALSLAQLQLGAGENEKAKESFKALMKTHPNDVPVLEQYVVYLEKTGQREGAGKIRDHIKVVKGLK